jgi:SAM-dependent methyltransferase
MTHDWEIIAARDPFFGVLVADEFRADRIDDAARQRFYETGRADIAQVLEMFDAEFGARPSQGTALDIGCGVGRLAYAMATIVPKVVGYDVAESMVSVAQAGAPPNASFTTQLPEGPFSWINSFIVFQHIPSEEGLALLRSALDRLAPGGFASIQLTAWNTQPPQPDSLLDRFRRWRNLRIHRQPGRNVQPLIRMHDYNFSEVMRCFMDRGMSRLVLRHTAHGEHHGAWVLARR